MNRFIIWIILDIFTRLQKKLLQGFKKNCELQKKLLQGFKKKLHAPKKHCPMIMNRSVHDGADEDIDIKKTIAQNDSAGRRKVRGPEDP